MTFGTSRSIILVIKVLNHLPTFSAIAQQYDRYVKLWPLQYPRKKLIDFEFLIFDN